MNLKFIKMIGNKELYVNSDTLEYVTKREYSLESLELLQSLQRIGTKLNIPKLYQIEIMTDKVVTYEQYIDGQTIDEMIEAGQFINCKQFEQYILALVKNLQVLHANEIIHKDVKPGNIVISGEQVYLIDFNISRTYKADQSKDTQLFGTEGYASPEQYGFSQTTHKSDIYSLGKTLIDLMSITVLSPEQFKFYTDIFEGMTSLDPEARISLEQLLEAIGHGMPLSKKIAREVRDNEYIGIIKTRGGLVVSLIVSLFFLSFAYDIVIEDAVHTNGMLVWVQTFVIYYFGAVAMNKLIIPKFRKWWLSQKSRTLLLKSMIWFWFRFGELFAFALVLTVELSFINAIF